MTTGVFLVDLLLLIGVLAAVFGAGTVLLLLAKRRRPDDQSLWQWIKATYTWRRWLTNPFKMSIVAMVWQTNFQQLALTGPVSSFADELDYRSRLYLVLANLIGACICFYGLHLRDFERALWIEASAYISMIGTLAIWVALVYLTVPLPNTGYGLNLAEGVVIAASIRLPLILTYKRLLHTVLHRPDPDEVRKLARMRAILASTTITDEQSAD